MRYTGPKTRLARRVGEPLRDKDTKYLVKRSYPPGMHGQSRRRISEYGTQFLEKQKAKWTYGVTERQFRRYISAATSKKGTTGDFLLESLELRLDNIVYRLGFAGSRAQARQIVGHGFITVNGKRVDIPSYRVAAGDQIALAAGKRASKYAQLLAPRLREHKALEWLELDAKNFSGKVMSRPTRDNTGTTLRMELIIEHYSR
ncbi:MAG: 30S ribosomal protein S4 [Candidatus Doudnabacteria bacterium]|nr:30S ribosomal protein S4 [Candidatus Doudnabacteria bacterium]